VGGEQPASTHRKRKAWYLLCYQTAEA